MNSFGNPSGNVGNARVTRTPAISQWPEVVSFPLLTSRARPQAPALTAMEKQMEQTIGCIQGVGRVKVMLTLKSGTALELASDGGDTLRDTESKTDRQVVKLNRGSGIQDVVVTRRTYPTFQGAVVVCDGASASAVRLAVIQAVSVLTGLSSDRISVVQWKSS